VNSDRSSVIFWEAPVSLSSVLSLSAIFLVWEVRETYFDGARACGSGSRTAGWETYSVIEASDIHTMGLKEIGHSCDRILLFSFGDSMN
jgi:hypothetical protein